MSQFIVNSPEESTRSEVQQETRVRAEVNTPRHSEVLHVPLKQLNPVKGKKINKNKCTWKTMSSKSNECQYPDHLHHIHPTPHWPALTLQHTSQQNYECFADAQEKEELPSENATVVPRQVAPTLPGAPSPTPPEAPLHVSLNTPTYLPPFIPGMQLCVCIPLSSYHILSYPTLPYPI